VETPKTRPKAIRFPLEAPIVFWWTDTGIEKTEVRAALMTLARWEHSFLPISAHLRESKSASRSSCQYSLALSPKHEWKRWGTFCVLNRSAGLRDATALRSRLATPSCGLATIPVN